MGGFFGSPAGLTMVALFIIFVFGTLVLLGKRYKRCPSNRILVIYGKVKKGQTAKCIHGGAAFVIPLIQDFEYLSLEPIQIEVPLRDALSSENIRVNVPSVFTVALGTEVRAMNNASIRLLSLNIAQIKKQAEDIIFGQLRQVIASMRIEDINRDRESFLSAIQISLEPELEKIGMVLINVNITDITDESGYIEAIGKKAASEAIQRARGDVADEQKKGEIRVAEANREKEVQVAENKKTEQIGVRAAQREQAVRVAQLAKEQVVGEQTAAFNRDTQVKEAEQTMRVAVASADAAAIEGENESKALVADSDAMLKVKEADAFQLGSTRAEVAKAAVLEAKNRALAKAAIADAERVEAEQRAELEAKAKAEKAQTIVEAEAESEKLRIEAEGEAAAIFAKLEAEAKGNYEILAKKGDGLKRIVEACGGSQEAFKLLMLEHLDTLAETSAQAISNIKFDKVIVWENGNGSDGNGSTAGFLSNLAQTLPPMMNVMKDIGGVEFPESFVKIKGDDDREPKAEAKGKGADGAGKTAAATKAKPDGSGPGAGPKPTGGSTSS